MPYADDPLVKADVEFRHAIAKFDSQLREVLDWLATDDGLTVAETEAGIRAAVKAAMTLATQAAQRYCAALLQAVQTAAPGPDERTQ